MSADWLRLRRGVGIIYVIAGILHGAMMAYATLYSMGLIRSVVPAVLWSEMYFAHFLFMVLGGFIYLGLSFKQAGVFHHEPLTDFCIGLAAFFVIMSAVSMALVMRLVPGWCSLSMSAFLFFYGLGLTQGRACGFGPKPPPLP